MKWLLGAALGLAAASTPRQAMAAPQWNASALLGVCGKGSGSTYWESTCIFNGVRGDVLFGRSRSSDAGIGPELEITKYSLRPDEFRLGAGITGLLPIHPYFPVQLTAGGYERFVGPGFEPGLHGSLFIGSRSYNFHSNYSLAAGLILTVQHSLGDSRENLIAIGAQIDGLLMVLPFLLVYDWIRGAPSDE